MNFMFLWLTILVISNTVSVLYAQHEDVPYENVQDICKRCTCSTPEDIHKRYHYVLSCVMKNFHHILARWPEEFGEMNEDIDILATFSGNPIDLLQQLPATNASLSFACRHCGIRTLQSATFLDVPNIKRFDLSWNDVENSALSSDVFRGPFRQTYYEPIGLVELKLDHNKLSSLNSKLFEHTPYLKILDMSYNKFEILDSPTLAALSSLTELEVLNLCHNRLSSIDAALMFKSLINLKELNLSYNDLKTVPESLRFAGKSLEELNLAGNLIKSFKGTSLSELKMLKYLNISHNNVLNYIGKHSLLGLDALKYLDCSYNPQLETFDLNDLLSSRNLIEVDISNCAIKNITLDMNEAASATSSNNTMQILPWPKLLHFQIFGNPWQCDCTLLHTLEFMGVHHQSQVKDEARCDTPYKLSGIQISNLTTDYICSLRIPTKYSDSVERPSRFLRKRYIILTVTTASAVTALGLIVGLIIACIRKRLAERNIEEEPVRYRSIRSSNILAFYK